MKMLLILSSMIFSLNAFSCPDISGKFLDSDTESIRTIVQDLCTITTWTDQDGSTVLIADNIERVLQSEGSMTAFAKVSFTDSDLIIDIRMDYGGHNDFDLPVRWMTSYRIDKYNNLVEKIIPFKEDGSIGGTEYVTFRRVP